MNCLKLDPEYLIKVDGTDPIATQISVNNANPALVVQAKIHFEDKNNNKNCLFESVRVNDVLRVTKDEFNFGDYVITGISSGASFTILDLTLKFSLGTFTLNDCVCIKHCCSGDEAGETTINCVGTTGECVVKNPGTNTTFDIRKIKGINGIEVTTDVPNDTICVAVNCLKLDPEYLVKVDGVDPIAGEISLNNVNISLVTSIKIHNEDKNTNKNCFSENSRVNDIVRLTKNVANLGDYKITAIVIDVTFVTLTVVALNTLGTLILNDCVCFNHCCSGDEPGETTINCVGTTGECIVKNPGTNTTFDIRKIKGISGIEVTTDVPNDTVCVAVKCLKLDPEYLVRVDGAVPIASQISVNNSNPALITTIIVHFEDKNTNKNCFAENIRANDIIRITKDATNFGDYRIIMRIVGVSTTTLTVALNDSAGIFALNDCVCMKHCCAVPDVDDSKAVLSFNWAHNTNDGAIELAKWQGNLSLESNIETYHVYNSPIGTRRMTALIRIKDGAAGVLFTIDEIDPVNLNVVNSGIPMNLTLISADGNIASSVTQVGDLLAFTNPSGNAEAVKIVFDIAVTKPCSVWKYRATNAEGFIIFYSVIVK